MLSGVRVVDRSAAERLVREEKEQRRKEKKEKKRHKKVRWPASVRTVALSFAAHHAGSSAALKPAIFLDVQEKKSKHKPSRRHASDSDACGGSSSDGGGAAPGRRRRREEWDDPEDSGSGSGSDGEQGVDGQLGRGRGAAAQREDWMTKPMARPKTDAQLAAEEEERERAAEEARKRDPDRQFVSVRGLPRQAWLARLARDDLRAAHTSRPRTPTPLLGLPAGRFALLLGCVSGAKCTLHLL